MRLVTYEYGGASGAGRRTPEGIVPTGYPSMLALIESGAVAAALPDRAALPADACRILAPIPRPPKLLFSGLNYRSHTEENPEAVLPDYPQVFAKLPSSVIGPDEPIVLPGPGSQVDYEVELAVVIGKTARRLTHGTALGHVFGYTVVNDVSGRDVQFKDNQITTGKGFDTFCPMGPEIATADEIPDPQALRVSSAVNGETRQSSPTADMLFDVATLLAFLSAQITLYPGDIVSTGTPAGVGTFRRPPVYLRPGDTVTVAVDRIGALSNPVVAGW